MHSPAECLQVAELVPGSVGFVFGDMFTYRLLPQAEGSVSAPDSAVGQLQSSAAAAGCGAAVVSASRGVARVQWFTPLE